jgi:hypothetical protein
MENNNWISVEYLNNDDFCLYMDTLSEDEKAVELAQFSKRVGKKMLKDEMKKNNCFYNFIKSYSSRDFKIIKNKKHVSQRVICKHVKYWNETHPNNKIKNLRIFFY